VPITDDDWRGRPRNPLDLSQKGPHTLELLRNATHDHDGYQIHAGDINLRLVCKAFDRAMTRAFFNTESAIFRAHETDAVQRLQEFIIDEQATIAPYVKCLEIELTGKWSGPFEFRKATADPEKTESLAVQLNKFLPKLEDAVARLPKLVGLIFDINEKLESIEPVIIAEDDEEEMKKCHGPVVDLELQENIRSTIAHVFSSLRVDFQSLTYLRLTLFCTYDLATVGKHISDETAMQLRYLHLEYTDSTGQAGSRYYSRYTEDQDEDGTDNMPFSNLQLRYPNIDYMSGVCNLISRCRALQSLSVEATQCLDLKDLDWRPATSGLENVLLKRVVINSATLLALTSSSDTSVSNIVAFDMREVKLWDGTWGTIFDRLAAISSLGDVYVDNLFYDASGESAGNVAGNGRLWEDSRVLWSEEEEDAVSLQKLVKCVEKRTGRESMINGIHDDEDEEDEEDEEDSSELMG
jgi:hypothetical protein